MNEDNVVPLRVVAGGPDQSNRDKAAADLEAIAAQVRAGTISDYAIVTAGKDYTVMFWASRFDGLGLAALMQNSAMNRMKA